MAAGRATVQEKQWPTILYRMFAAPSFAWMWLAVRVWLGYQWLEAGRHKIIGPGWLDGGESLKGFWERAVAIPAQGRPPITFAWYRDFIQFMLEREWYEWFAWLIAVGEFAVGVFLIIGAFSAFAAAGGALMNINFLLAGTASSNPVLLMAGLLIVGAYKIAGYWGVDRVLLPALGTPWQPGPILRRMSGRLLAAGAAASHYR